LNALFAIAYASVGGFAPGTAVANIQITLTGSAAGNTTPVVGTVAPGTTSADIALSVADTYGYSVVAVDASGKALGTPVTGSFVLTAPATISLQLPSTVSVTQSAS